MTEIFLVVYIYSRLGGQCKWVEHSLGVQKVGSSQYIYTFLINNI